MKLKALFYLISQNKRLFFKFFFKNPILYSFRYFKSLLFPKIVKENNIKLFGINNLNQLNKLLSDLDYYLLIAFSYCQKPIDCPSLQFSDTCANFCNKCEISKYMNLKNSETMIIKTASDIGKKILKLSKDKGNKLIFLISACDMAITMFEDLAKTLNLKGIAMPLEGWICTTFDSFLLAEKGIKKKQTQLNSSSLALLDQIAKYRS